MQRVLAAVALLAAPATAQELLERGALEEWGRGQPSGWVTLVGAGDAKGPASKLEPILGGGMAMSGDARTRSWTAVRHPFAAKPGTTYRLRFEARALGVRREAGQHDNCWAGLWFEDARNRRLDAQPIEITTDEWAPHEGYATAPEGTAAASAMVFLSKTGRLEIRDVQCEAVATDPASCFEVLVARLDRSYSYFAHRAIDWPALTGRYRERAGAAAGVDEFVAVIREMLLFLQDEHVWIDLPDGGRVQPYAPVHGSNFDIKAVASAFQHPRNIGTLGAAARTADGFGYVLVGSMQATPQEFAPLVEAFDALLDAPGLILDLRANGGGNEANGWSIASAFVAAPTVYAKRQRRAGPKHTDLTPPAASVLQPRPEGRPRYDRPVVVLIGPGCVSSGEGMALMLKACPNVTLVGQPTRGASGNPQPIGLPNGVRVWASTWVAMDAQGEVIEGTGVAPDVEVVHTAAGDPTFARAVELLRERITK